VDFNDEFHRDTEPATCDTINVTRELRSPTNRNRSVDGRSSTFLPDQVLLTIVSLFRAIAIFLSLIPAKRDVPKIFFCIFVRCPCSFLTLRYHGGDDDDDDDDDPLLFVT